MSVIDTISPSVPSNPTYTSRPLRPKKPNYNQLHSKPLPLTIYPCPPLIPHNPLSVLYFAYTYISQYFNPPSSHPKARVQGIYSEVTRSVHVTNDASIRLLWEAGFYGKGSLSRSEPTWLDAELKRKGLKEADTSETVTAARREERRRFKMDRAKKEQEIINEKLMEELLVDKIASAQITGRQLPRGPTLRSKYEGIAEAALLSPSKQGFLDASKGGQSPPPYSTPNDASGGGGLQAKAHKMNGVIDRSAPAKTPESSTQIKNQEHLQLNPEEAFFLTYALGILDVYMPTPNLSSLLETTDVHTPPHIPLSPSTLLQNFLTTDTFPPSPQAPLLSHDPSSPFLLSYVTYHHFRSLGWVVRPGTKFGVDWLLYLRGPVFSHAEFAVVIMPAYTHPYWRRRKQRRRQPNVTEISLDTTAHDADQPEQQLDEVNNDPNHIEHSLPHSSNQFKTISWHQIHTFQRVQAQVRKSLVIAWVDIPPPFEADTKVPGQKPSHSENYIDETQAIDISQILSRYKVREMMLKRWIPNRSRD